MRIYLAAQFRRREELAGHVPAFEAAGHEVTSRWLGQDTPADGKMTNHEPETNVRFAEHDLEDVDAADALVFFAEDPLIGIPRGGRHVEFGWALASGKKIAVVGPRENVFHWLLPTEAIHASVEALLVAGEDGFHHGVR
jgi:nucleoside 2-deoxyribosyltransferase